MTSIQTLYFGFGSNLWKDQMARRCPASPFVGVGRLRGYHWFINVRGYANIAKTRHKTNSYNHKPAIADEEELEKGEEDYENQVWGFVYSLSTIDEARLDKNEGVPYSYEKRIIDCELGVGGEDAAVATAGGWRTVPMLVYIDFRRTEGGHLPKAEYVHRMNMGIRDALSEGVPRKYVERVLRRYIPTEGEEDEGARELARRQAGDFQEESEILGEADAGSGAVSSES
ncbi:Gamma-glutamylcyclotransferase [Madurella mycetomatis]|uniref:gamma-glutamylcyclotransferase n=1 Tax=Madurella mycetomatis TaxID=100816 RepID=A0A175VZR0_9PEZI|nr:Gamma-glutamylcyclotransferase [Madurella mycetomatis]